MMKAMAWGALSLVVIAAILSSQHSFVIRFQALTIFLVIVGLVLLTKFSSPFLHAVKEMGVNVLAIGVIGAVMLGESPAISGEWLAVFMSLPLAILGVLASRYLLVHQVFNRWMRRRFRQQVLILGSGEAAKRTANHIIDQNAPFWIAGFLSREKGDKLDVSRRKSRLGDFDDLPHLVSQNHIDEIVVAPEDIDLKMGVRVMDYGASAAIALWFVPEVFPIIASKVETRGHCALPMVQFCSQKNGYTFDKMKYGLDALVSLPLFVLLLPIFLIIAVCIQLESRGPVFYRPKMVGKGGRTFRMYKFRTMHTGASNAAHKEYVAKFIKGKIPQGENEENVFKITDDPRVTSVGRFLRKWSLDELPQLINVLKGEMSLTGPRPCLTYEYALYEDWHKRRDRVRPGISGIWQVKGRNAVTFGDMVLLDLYYVYNRSLFMDIKIMCQTVVAVLSRAGAV